MQGQFACLIITGHRAVADWFVSQECEYLRLPGWDGLFEDKARYWGRKPFLTIAKEQAVELRRQIINGVIQGFKPDAIIVDHLPLGMEEELAPILENTPCRKYLVTRGILNETEDLRKLILGGRAYEFLNAHYDRIFVAVDPKVFNFVRQYNISPEIRLKTIHTGYVTQAPARESRIRVRSLRGVGEDDIWVVASAGGGQHGEGLIKACINMAKMHPSIYFDIVMGPRSNTSWDHPERETKDWGKMRVHKHVSWLSSMNSGADLVITSGGYNTILEALQGQADLLCFPSRTDLRDEQYHHAMRLQRFVNIDISIDVSQLSTNFERALAHLRQPGHGDRRKELDFNGAKYIHKVVEEDLTNKVKLDNDLII